MLLDTFFEKKLASLKLDDVVKAYIISVMKNQAFTVNDLDGTSIVEAYVNALNVHSFEKLQNVGDWTLWRGVFRPQEFEIHEDANVYVAKLAYHDCHVILRRSWKVFETLSHDFLRIVRVVRSIEWNDCNN